LPELLLARRRRIGAITAASLSLILVLGGDDAFWGIPLMLLSLPVGGYPLRRSLGIDTAGLVPHVWRQVKSVSGSIGFWVLVAWMPLIVFAIPAKYRLAAWALVPLLWAWDHWFSRIWLRLHDAVPFTSGEIEPRVAEIADRAGMRPPPDVYAIGSPGARWVNAVALPSVRHPAIVFGNALVELLEPDEVAAIYAHELSHLEQHGPRMMRRRRAMTRVLIVLAVAVPLIAERLVPGNEWLIRFVWPVVVLMFLALRGRGHQQRETESDLRAAALCGDPELVARALIKVHVHGLIPRRWSVDFESRASHPSLARRIQALRGTTATPVSATAPVILPTAREGTVLAFDDARAYWFDGVPPDAPGDLDALRARASSVRSVAWPELVELRVTAVGTERALVAAHRNGDRWSVPLDSAHVADVQRALDRVDVRLHRELGKRPFPSARVVAALILLTMLGSTEIGVLMIAASIAAFRPSLAALAAMGTMAIGTVAVDVVRDWPLDSGSALRIAVLGVLGAIGLALAWREAGRDRAVAAKRREHRAGARPALAILGLSALVLGLVLGGAAGDLPLAQVARLPMAPALGVTLLGFGSALFVWGGRIAIASAGAAMFAGALLSVPAIVSADTLSASATLSRSAADASEIARIPGSTNVFSVDLSPEGRRLLVRHYDNSGRPDANRYTLRSLDGASRELTGVQLAFADEDRVLLLRRAGDSLSLQLERADSGNAVWSVALPPILGPRLRASPHDRVWSIVGQDEEGDSLVVVSGTIDSANAAVRRLKSMPTPLGAAAISAVGARLVVSSYDIGNVRANPFSLLAMMSPRATLWEISATGRKRIGEMRGFPLCGDADDGTAACVVREQRQSEVWALADTGSPRMVGRLSLDDVMRASPGPGPRVTAIQRDAAIIVDAARGRLTRVRLPADSGYAIEAHSVPGRLAVLRRTTEGSTIVLYRIP
jgi:Zn-dependent protease with chaperone function